MFNFDCYYSIFTFAREWINRWNAHNLEQILAHYTADIQFTSPIIKQLGIHAEGHIKGLTSLRNYSRIGLERYPNLHFDLYQELTGLDSVVLIYKSIHNTLSAEYMAFKEVGKVREVVAHYTSYA